MAGAAARGEARPDEMKSIGEGGASDDQPTNDASFDARRKVFVVIDLTPRVASAFQPGFK